MYDLVIRDAVIVTPQGQVRGDLGTVAGQIAAIGLDLGPALDEVDAGGRLLLPGGIDSHCHIDQTAVAGEPPCPDDWTSATRAAVAGGTTTVIPQSMAARGADIERELQRHLDRAHGAALADHAVIVQMPQAEPGFLARGLPALAARGFRAVKMFSTYPGYALSDLEIRAILAAAAPLGVLGILHAEDDAMIRAATAAELAAGRTGLERQPHARPAEAEAAMIDRAAAHAREVGARLHVYHLSGAMALAAVARARAAGTMISAETCAHYLEFSALDLARPDFEGAKFLCAPPLRDPADRQALWAALARGGLDCVSSDHSPSHRLPAIARAQAGAAMDFTSFGGGFPGLQTVLPSVFSGGVTMGILTPERFAEITATIPARLFGLKRKGRLEIGRDADLCLWDPRREWTVRLAAMYSRVDFTPWDGVVLTGRPVLTVVRGRIVMREGQIEETAIGHGRLVAMEGEL
jgi:dihydropyrimidinase